jgi:hypothetical protein
VMMSMLCNCCVRELLILARTWFAFGLPSKTGCDNVIQCMFASVRCSSGARGGWSSGVDFFARPLLPTLVGLLVRVASWCRRCRFRSSDEVLSSFVGGDVEVHFPE